MGRWFTLVSEVRLGDTELIPRLHIWRQDLVTDILSVGFLPLSKLFTLIDGSRC